MSLEVLKKMARLLKECRDYLNRHSGSETALRLVREIDNLDFGEPKGDNDAG